MPACRRTAYSSGDSWARHSSSVLVTWGFSAEVVMPPRYDRCRATPTPDGTTGRRDLARSTRCPTSGSPATCRCCGPSPGWWTAPSTAARRTCSGAVVPASGLPKAEVIAAAQALASAGYIEPLTNHNGDIVRITAISAEARRLAGLWPTPQGEWDRLLEQLPARAAERGDRGRAGALAGVRRRGRRRGPGRRGAADVGAHRRLRAPRSATLSAPATRNDSAPARRTGRGRCADQKIRAG